MQRLVKRYHSSLDSGSPLPPVFHQLEQLNARFRLGQLAMLVGAPGVAKTVFALTLARKINLPVLYFSADTGDGDIFARCASIETGELLDVIDHAISNGGKHNYDLDITKFELKIKFDWKSVPTERYINDAIEAFNHLYADYPYLVVVDGLRNLHVGDGADDYANFRHATEFLSILARETGSCVLLLHHLTGAYANGNIPPTSQAIEGKVDKNASMIIGLYNTGPGALGFTVLKNRKGPAQGDGSINGQIGIDLSRMLIGGYSNTIF